MFVDVGLKATPLVTLFDQMYDVAPLPVKVVELPLQIVVTVALAITVGNWFTVIDIAVDVAEQLLALVTETV